MNIKEEEVKLSSFTYNSIVYVENPNKSKKIFLLELISEFSNVVVAYLYLSV